MLSLFPSLLAYEQVAPFLLRIALGAIFLSWSYKKLRSREDTKVTALGIFKLAIGILLVIGLYTQLAALVASIIFVIHLGVKIRTKSLFTDGMNYGFIFLAVSLSLLFLGAGVFSFDLPL